jgi:hypothetical protein
MASNINAGSLANYQLFPREYFSGADVYLMFNNVMVDEIVSLEFNLQEQSIPIYGYASFTYDAIAHGARLVTGSFTINFKETFYIRETLSRLSINKINSSNPGGKTKDKALDRLEVDKLISFIKGSSINDIEQAADKYENALWGAGSQPRINKYKDPFFANLKGANEEKYNPILEYGFDIIINFGNEIEEIYSSVDQFPSTVKIINGVHLTGVQMIATPTGEPILEKYTFIAKDLDNTLIKGSY